VVVGDSLCPTFEKPFYWSDRATETMGRGGFLIHPYVKGMDLFFQNEEHLVYYNYGDFEDLFAKIDYYLENGLERKIIATKGMLHVRDNHTYKNRFTQILTTLALLEPQLRGKV
jgi:spore maturation protein CgeB